MFEARGGVADAALPCPECGRQAQRQAVYREQGVIFYGGGFTKATLPPPGADAQAEMGKELRKAGWSVDRAVEEMRANRAEDKEGRTYINTAAMTKVTGG